MQLISQMKNALTILLMCVTGITAAQDEIKTKNGSFNLHFVGHGSLYIEFQGQIIHVDPWSAKGDYTQMPDADYILITHQHRDHLDQKAIAEILKENTVIIAPKVCQDGLSGFHNVNYIANDESYNAKWGVLEAVPAYNIKHMREPGLPFHPKGEGNGYVLSLDGTKVYIAGDTENIPEMKNLKNIDVAFLPMNLPYTMTPEMVAEAARMFNPKILYPYHFGETDTSLLQPLIKDTAIEIRIRNMQ